MRSDCFRIQASNAIRGTLLYTRNIYSTLCQYDQEENDTRRHNCKTEAARLNQQDSVKTYTGQQLHLLQFGVTQQPVPQYDLHIFL